MTPRAPLFVKLYPMLPFAARNFRGVSCQTIQARLADQYVRSATGALYLPNHDDLNIGDAIFNRVRHIAGRGR